MNNEFELIEHNSVADFYAFLIEMKYRVPHLHTDIEVIYVLKGTLVIHSEEKTHVAHANQLIILNSCQLHELISDDSALLLVFQLGLKQFEKSFPQIYELIFKTKPCNINTCSNKQTLLNYFFEASHAYFNETNNYALLCHGLASLIMFEIIQVIPYKQVSEESKNRLLQKNERIRRISDYIHHHYQKKLLLSDIAKNENLTVPYLSHFFKDHFGLSFQEYLNTIRCEKAQQLLAHTSDTLLAISELCGFSDVKYLNRSFKLLYGITPKEFRRQSNKILFLQIKHSSDKKIDQQFIFSNTESLEIISKHIISNSTTVLP